MSGIPAQRIWQKTARAEVTNLWRTDVSAKALIAACPGAGKTFFTCTLIRELMEAGEVDLAIILAPTINIQLQWVNDFKKVGIKASSSASNFALRWRKEANVTMAEDNKVVVLTYAQLARDPELIAEMARRGGKTFLVGDEIHHADDDESFGRAVELLRESCARSLALSGTPFNSTGGALALCDDETGVDENGKPIRTTKSTFCYSYGEAINDNVCRPVEFIKVYGRGEATYRLISDNTTFKRVTDLAKQRKADQLSILLDPEGEFMGECAVRAVRSLAELRAAGDRKAGMLVVAKSKEHGRQMANLLREVCSAEGHSFFIQELYNDTPKAHDRIKDLETDTTDIVVSVRMISEGVDIKRLRVGLFATDWMTRMFFIQFIGRFVRSDDRLSKTLGKTQFARIIIPAHILLLTYAREIEEMIETSAILEAEKDLETTKKMETTEFVSTTTEAGLKGTIYRAEESEKLDLAEAFYKQAPSSRGLIPDAIAIKIAEELGLDGASPDAPKEKVVDWGSRNENVARNIVKRLKTNGQPDDVLFSVVNARANKAVGILKKDKLTPENVLIRRHAYLTQWLLRLMHGQDETNAA
jgi:superfamily II DNA or RNA helicase